MVFNRKSDGRVGDPLPTPSQPPPAPGRATPPPAPPRQSQALTVPSESIIGADLSIEGQSITIRCRGSLRVNGTIHADVHSMQVVVGEQALINGSLAADTVNVFGKVNGAILGSRVILHPSATVEGDIHSQVLSIEQGASFDGRSRKVTDPKEIAPQLEPTGHSSASSSSSSSAYGSQTSSPYSSPSGTPVITVPTPKLYS